MYLFTPLLFPLFFFFNAPPPTEIYTLSLHDALPISKVTPDAMACAAKQPASQTVTTATVTPMRSEEHTSELQSPYDLVCRLLLEKKKKKKKDTSNEVQTNITTNTRRKTNTHL